MRLDDLARRAAAEARRTASDLAPAMDPARYRRRRDRRGGLVLAASAAVLAAVAVTVLVVADPEEDTVAVTTSLPTTTTVTVPSAPPDSEGPSVPVSILGAGWEDLDAGPMSGRYRVAAAWTGSELFVWGGVDTEADVAPEDADLFHHDGFVHDPATGGWRSVAPMPEEICRPLRDPVAVAAGDVVVVRGGAVVVDSCTSAAAYRPASDSWQPLRGEFFRRAGRLVGVAWTGELLVAPRVGLAYDMASGETMELPPFPSGSDDAVLSPQRAHWTGDRVLSIGSGSLREWVPGRDQWTLLSDPPVPDRARDSAWTDQGLLVVDYEMSAAFYLGGGWVRPGDLPLRFYECPAEAISVGGTPVVRTCAGIAIWDQVRGSWVPVPLDGLPSWGSLVSSDNALYTVGPHLRRLRIERNPDGSVVVPPTIPVGDVNLDIPAGFEFVGSNLTESDVVVDQELGVLYSRAISVVFEAEGGRRCTVSSTYSSYPDLTGGIAEVTVSRPGRSGLVVTEFIGPEGGVGFGYMSSTSDVAMVVCETFPPGVDQEQWRADALAFTAGLWSPWEEPPVEPDAYVARGECGTDNMPDGWQGDAVKLGPLWLWHVAPPGRGNGGDPATKTIAVLEPGEAVTVSIAPSYRHRAAHLFDPTRWNSAGTYRVATQGAAVTFLPCDDWDAEFVGGFVFTGDPCVEIEVTIGDARPFRAALPFSSAPCSESIYTQSRSDCAVSSPHLTGSAGALPRKGLTTEERVRRIVEADRDAILQHLFTQYFVRAVDVRLVERRGEVWDWVDASVGEYRIERVVDFQIEVLLDADEPCPEAGTIWDGVPLVFNRAWATHEAQGLRFEVPSDWILADESLTPNLAVPGEVFSAATYPMRPGGSRCAHVPEYAMEDLGPTDAFVSVQWGPARYASESRPDVFTFAWLDERGRDTESPDCLSREDRHTLYIRGGSFLEGGRALLVIVAVGDGASEETRAAVLRILDSMEWVDR